MRWEKRLGRLAILPAAILILAGAPGTISRALPATVNGHTSSLPVRIALRDGSSRIATLRGVGCSVSICSRVAVRSTTDSAWLDSIASIADITNHDALFVFKNGSERRLSIPEYNRFLYFNTGKLNLGALKSISFLEPAEAR